MLRIHQWREEPRTVLKLEGRLAGDSVAELERVLAGLPPEEALDLDLEGLGHADEAGLAILRAAIAGGARVRSISGFVACLLKGPLPAGDGH